jgi:phosphomannomutase
MSPNIFRTYDIRGIYPTEVNEKAAFLIGRGLGRFFGKKSRPKIAVARDGRISSPKLYRALIKGLKTQNPRLTTIGLATTPMFYVLVQLLKMDGGIIVTASHNPGGWNGFKVVGYDAEMIGGKEVLKIITTYD